MPSAIQLFLLFSFLTQSIMSQVTFDKFGRTLISASQNSHFNISYIGNREFLQVMHTTGENVMVWLEINGVSIHHKRSSSYWYITITPERLPVSCRDVRCHLTVVLVVSITGDLTVPIQLEKGLMLQPNAVWSNTLSIRRKRRYAYSLREGSAPVFIQLVPAQRTSNMDLDLFAYHETSSVYFFPNIHEQNHLGGYPESVTLSPDKSYFVADGLYFFEVYASPDSSYETNTYSIGIQENYVEQVDWFDYYIFGFILIVGSAFIFSLAVSIACGYIHAFPSVRSRIFYWLRLRDNPNPNGASKSELKRIDVVTLEDSGIDAEEDICSICLDDFIQDGVMSRLPCSHVFHKECSETWLRRNKTCPLCKHDISRPINEIAVDDEGEGGSATDTMFQRLAQIARQSRFSRVFIR